MAGDPTSTCSSDALVRAQRVVELAGALARRLNDALLGREGVRAAVVFRKMEDVAWTRETMGELKALVRSLGVLARGGDEGGPFLRVVTASGRLGEVVRVEALGRVVANADMIVHDERANPRKRRARAGEKPGGASRPARTGGQGLLPAPDERVSTESMRDAALEDARDTATSLLGRMEVRLF